MMTSEEKVKKVWPDAECVPGWDGVYRIFSHGIKDHGIAKVIGAAKTRADAWDDAASRLPAEPQQGADMEDMCACGHIRNWHSLSSTDWVPSSLGCLAPGGKCGCRAFTPPVTHQAEGRGKHVPAPKVPFCIEENLSEPSPQPTEQPALPDTDKAIERPARTVTWFGMDCVDTYWHDKAEAYMDSLEQRLQEAMGFLRDYRISQLYNHRSCVVRTAGLVHGTKIDDRCPICKQVDQFLKEVRNDRQE